MTVKVNDFGMFFLRDKGERLESVSAYYPSILAARDGCRSRGGAIERVVAEIECILKSPITTRRDLVTAIQYLRTVPAVNAIPALKAASPTLPSPIDVLAGYILLHHNDLSLLPLVEKSLQESSKLAVQAEGSSMGIRFERGLDVYQGSRGNTLAEPADVINGRANPPGRGRSASQHRH